VVEEVAETPANRAALAHLTGRTCGKDSGCSSRRAQEDLIAKADGASDMAGMVVPPGTTTVDVMECS